MSDSDEGGGIITGIIVVAAVIIDALGIIGGAIEVFVDAFAAAAAAAATDFERANFSARSPWSFVGFIGFVFVFVFVFDEVLAADGIMKFCCHLLWT